MQREKRVVHRCLAITFAVFAITNRLAAEATLGTFPLCEASAAVVVNCPGRAGQCLLVGDNEVGSKLFLFQIEGEKLHADAPQDFELQVAEQDEISDIEALASVSDDEILAFGSHSRNSRCKVKNEKKENRHLFGKVSLSKGKTAVVDTLRSKKLTCEHLFGKHPVDAAMEAACEAIDTADLIAGLVEEAAEENKLTKDEAKTACNAVNAYNAEGAVAIDTRKGTEVWVGLRAPLLRAHPSEPEKRNLALLLRMKGQTAYTFDRVAFVDLGGRGVRDLSSDATSIWVIAGPAEDRDEPFELRRFPKPALGSTAVIDAELVRTLPTSSEGLAISGKTAYIVIDKDKGKDNKKGPCKQPAQYEIVSLP